MPFPTFIADIGGTYARLALVDAAGAPFRLLDKQETGSTPDPSEAFRRTLAAEPPPPPRGAILAVAGPVTGPVVRLTNAPWTIDAAAIGTALGLERVTIVNDFAATAASLAGLESPSPHLLAIGPELPQPSATRLVLGPGTGFGAAALGVYDGRLVVHTTEAGHMDFGARDARELALWARMRPEGGRLSVEDLLSGQGLARLYGAVCGERGVVPARHGPAEIVRAGLAGADEPAGETLSLFAKLLGRLAGDLALAFGARGGVYLAGGIAQRIAPAIAAGGFRAEFERKPPFTEVMRRIPTVLVTHPEPALLGLEALAHDSARFLLHAASWSRRA